jgi:hypothetical protein
MYGVQIINIYGVQEDNIPEGDMYTEGLHTQEDHISRWNLTMVALPANDHRCLSPFHGCCRGETLATITPSSPIQRD